MDAKDVLSYLFGRLKDTRPVTHEVGKQAYAVKSDGTLGEPVRELVPQFDKPTLNVVTLGGLQAVIDSDMDDLPDEVAFHVENIFSVALVSLKADAWGRRHVWARAKHSGETPFVFGKY